VGVLTRKLSAMRRVRVRHDPIFDQPLISPDIQGLGAWGLLTNNQRGHLEAALNDACKQLKCHRSTLQWRFDKHGAIHVRKTPRIEL